MAKGEHVTYVVQRLDQTGAIKIGQTRRLEARIAELRRQTGVRMSLLRVVPHREVPETLLHHALKQWIVGPGREWFAPTPEVVTAVLTWARDDVTQALRIAPTPHMPTNTYVRQAMAEKRKREAIALRERKRVVKAEAARLRVLGRMPRTMFAKTLRVCGITLQSMADTLGVTRQRVQQIATAEHGHCTHAATEVCMARVRECRELRKR